MGKSLSVDRVMTGYEQEHNVETSSLRHTQTRDQVLVAYAADQIARTSLSTDDFAQALSRALHDRCPGKAAEKDVPDFESDALCANPSEFLKAGGRWLKRVQRLLGGDQELPAWMEEAWVEALEPEWRERCINELASRYGLIGARSEGIDGCPVSAFGQLVAGLGEAVERCSAVLADGKIDEQDVPELPAAIDRLRLVESKSFEMRRRMENELAIHCGGRPFRVVG